MRLPGGGGMSVKDFLKDLAREYSRDNLGDAAAAVTYAGVLALFPFLLFLVALASVIIRPEQAEQLVASLGQVAPAEVTKIVGDRIRSLAQGSSPGLLTVGALGAIWAASSGIQALMRALNMVYGVQEGRPFWKAKLVALAMTVVAGTLSLLCALAMIAVPPIADHVGGPLGSALYWLRFPVAGLLMMLLWAVLYYVLPDVEQEFRFITPGSVGGVILWVVASWLFSVYVSNFGKYDATYGSLGGIIVLLLWMWISALVLLAGAESNAVIEHRSVEGKRVGAKEMADSGPSPTKAEVGRTTDPRQGTRASPGQDPRAARPARGPRLGRVPVLAALAAGAFFLRRGKARA